ncbi:TPA: ArsR family transcriptional regulator [Candidatus Woesearchaeota archaeon]|nr:ArsR family transcriptional regulator [Candidatus Woesearchaeota archaeon]
MLQKRNDLEIMEVLRKEPSHVREIAHYLQMIPSTVLRTLSILKGENVVDFNRRGKNTVYFLKDTLEAKSYLLLSEQYKLLKTLSQPALRRIIKECKDMAKEDLIILFGSHAKETATKSSDIDLYVETTDKDLKKKMEMISSQLSIKIGRFDKNSPLAKEIIKDHVMMQNAERFYHLIE